MLKLGPTVQHDATDLVGHLSCRHLTQLDHAVALGSIQRPHVWDPLLELLWERGTRHEQAYVGHLAAADLQVVKIEGIGVDDVAVAATLEAMRSGAAAIVQAALRSGRWVGRADVLRRVETPSNLGAWSYEPLDTKLARETKAAAVMQLCLYAELLKEMQGVLPEHAYIVPPWTDYQPQSFRVSDFAAYFRRIRHSLERALDETPHPEVYPEPNDYCDICRWRSRCEERRREDDHLCLVAGISKVQTNELEKHEVRTATELAALALPLPWRPERGAPHSYERIREQARIQVKGRQAGTVLYELLLPLSAECGLPRLAAVSVSGRGASTLKEDPARAACLRPDSAMLWKIESPAQGRAFFSSDSRQLRGAQPMLVSILSLTGDTRQSGKSACRSRP